MREELRCRLYPAGSFSELKYVVICARYQGRWLLSKHRERTTWEFQGGHIEAGETPLEAARREFFEESGVREAELYHICDYTGYDSVHQDNGAIYFANIHALGALPESEMERVELFEDLPENLTYPLVSPVYFREAERFAREQILL